VRLARAARAGLDRDLDHGDRRRIGGKVTELDSAHQIQTALSAEPAHLFSAGNLGGSLSNPQPLRQSWQMPFHRDALAVSLLLFAVIFLVWLVSGRPGWVALHEWQTLMASFVALGAASLAYKAAMAKVEFDRQVHQRNEIRSTLGLCLRLDFDLDVLRHEAEIRRNEIPDRFNWTKDKEYQAVWFAMKEPDALVEAWNHLDNFPPWIAEGLSAIRAHLYDLYRMTGLLGETTWNLGTGQRNLHASG
jgi:hypothetical protein